MPRVSRCDPLHSIWQEVEMPERYRRYVGLVAVAAMFTGFALGFVLH